MRRFVNVFVSIDLRFVWGLGIGITAGRFVGMEMQGSMRVLKNQGKGVNCTREDCTTRCVKALRGKISLERQRRDS